MRVLVIPDIHLKPWIFDRTEKILRDGKADRAVCLMDMPDDWNMEFQIERYKETFDRAIAFAEDYPDTLWCYGNHDVSYSWGRLETGYSPYAERTVMSKLEELENRLKSPVQINIMHRIDNVLFSHGGLTADFLRWLNKDLLDADIEEVIATVNDAPHDYLCLKRLPELTNDMVCILKEMQTVTIIYKLSVTNLEFTLGLTENTDVNGKKINDFFLPMSLRVEDTSVEKSNDGEIVDFIFSKDASIAKYDTLLVEDKNKMIPDNIKHLISEKLYSTEHD